MSAVSLGLAGATDPGWLRELAPAAEAAGFHALWLNDTPDGDALAGLAAVAEATTKLRLATGVVPIDRRGPGQIAAAAAGLPTERLVLGIGSGNAPHAVAATRSALRELRALTSARIVVGALGPRMRRLAAEEADGVLWNWLTPPAAAAAMGELRDQGGAGPRGILYVRTTADADARGALEAEAARYDSYPGYAANFERLGVRAIDTTIAATDEGSLVAGATAFREAVDELVLRAVVAEASLTAYRRFIDRAAAAVAALSARA